MFFRTCFSETPLFRALGAVYSPGGYENRVRDGLLHLLVVGNIWGVISNLFLILFSDFDVSCFCLCVFLMPKFRHYWTPGNSKNTAEKSTLGGPRTSYVHGKT